MWSNNTCLLQLLLHTSPHSLLLCSTAVNMSGQAALYDFLLTDIFSSVVTATEIWCCNIVKEVKGLRSRLALLFASEPDPLWIIPLVLFACLPHAHTWKTKPTTGFVPSYLCEFYEDRCNVPIQAARGQLKCLRGWKKYGSLCRWKLCSSFLNFLRRWCAWSPRMLSFYINTQSLSSRWGTQMLSCTHISVSRNACRMLLLVLTF